jgi:hypothetical protein
MRLAELLPRLPQDTQSRVEAARQRWNSAIREELRQETGLRLVRGGMGHTRRRLGQDLVPVPVRLREGLPTPLEKIELTSQEAGALIISRWRPDLMALRAGSAGVEQMLRAIRSQPDAQALVGPATVPLGPPRELAERVLALLDQHNPLGRLLAVENDVLGVYRYPAPKQAGLPQVDGTVPEMTVPDVSIELYWAVIGLFAPALGTSVEALAMVVLAHELAHAYTHVGADIDGQRWPTVAFAMAERALKEGLAQHYTERVCHRLDGQYPEALQAYEALLKRQSGPYLTHRAGRWAADYQPEDLRLAVIATRRQAVQSVEAFRTALGRARSHLRPAGR